MIEPIFSSSIQLFVAVLFAASCLHKLQDISGFRRIVGSYFRGSLLANTGFVRLAAITVVVWELSIVAAVLSGQAPSIVGLLACTLLLLYALGMGVNILRGNRLLDCGCSWGERVPVNIWLVVRNLVLVGLVGLLFLPVSNQDWSVFSAINALAFALAAYVIYLVIDLMILNQVLLHGEA